MLPGHEQSGIPPEGLGRVVDRFLVIDEHRQRNSERPAGR